MVVYVCIYTYTLSHISFLLHPSGIGVSNPTHASRDFEGILLGLPNIDNTIVVYLCICTYALPHCVFTVCVCDLFLFLLFFPFYRCFVRCRCVAIFWGDSCRPTKYRECNGRISVYIYIYTYTLSHRVFTVLSLRIGVSYAADASRDSERDSSRPTKYRPYR